MRRIILLAGTVPEVCGPAEVKCVPTYLPLFLSLALSPLLVVVSHCMHAWTGRRRTLLFREQKYSKEQRPTASGQPTGRRAKGQRAAAGSKK